MRHRKVLKKSPGCPNCPSLDGGAMACFLHASMIKEALFLVADGAAIIPLSEGVMKCESVVNPEDCTQEELCGNRGSQDISQLVGRMKRYPRHVFDSIPARRGGLRVKKIYWEVNYELD